GAAVAAGARKFTRIAVTIAVDPPAAPCGACRQLLAEFGLDLEVISAGPRANVTGRWGSCSRPPSPGSLSTRDPSRPPARRARRRGRGRRAGLYRGSHGARPLRRLLPAGEDRPARYDP